MYTAFIPESFLRVKENKKGLTKAGKWKSRLHVLPLNWSKIVWVFSGINENQKLFSGKSFQIYDWLQPFEVDTAEIRFFTWIMHYSRTEGRHTQTMTHGARKSWRRNCTMHMGSHHSWTRREARWGVSSAMEEQQQNPRSSWRQQLRRLLCLSVASVPLTSKVRQSNPP